MTDELKIQVLTDGSCPLCLWMRARVERFDTRQTLQWLNFRDPEVLQSVTPLTFEELNAEMHARKPDGIWQKGFAAWLLVLNSLPSLKWLGLGLGIWPFSKLGPPAYNWIAGHRFTLFGVPPPCSPDGVCSLHAQHTRAR
jgi:predicted DCC family thiol-disulfide oxidoreductase YuxK